MTTPKTLLFLAVFFITAPSIHSDESRAVLNAKLRADRIHVKLQNAQENLNRAKKENRSPERIEHFRRQVEHLRKAFDRAKENVKHMKRRVHAENKAKRAKFKMEEAEIRADQ
jgi:hypothetical protein